MYCVKCGLEFRAEYEWDENGFGYATKLVKCPECKHIITMEHVEDYALKMMNEVGLDPRYYEYNKE